MSKVYPMLCDIPIHQTFIVFIAFNSALLFFAVLNNVMNTQNNNVFIMFMFGGFSFFYAILFYFKARSQLFQKVDEN